MQSLPYRSEPDTGFQSVFTQRLNKKKHNNKNIKMIRFSLELEKLLIQARKHLYTSLTFTTLTTLTVILSRRQKRGRKFASGATSSHPNWS